MSLSNQPLTSGQKVLPSGALIPSGEANFYDFRQEPLYNGGSGINASYPNPSTFNPASGALATYGSTGSPTDTSGVFAYNNLQGPFSGSGDVPITRISDFTIFNNYIHYASGVGGEAIKIPYTSTYTVSTRFDPYRL